MLELSLLPFTTLSTERLLLRRVLTSDAADLFSMRGDPTVMQYIGRPIAQNIEDALELIRKYDEALEKNEGITWAITLKDESALIGTLGFWRVEKENYRCEIGYTLKPEYWRKGIMHEAIQEALKYAFNTLQFHSICANADPRNSASTKILEKNGFVREAYFKENFFFNGEFLDTVIYSLLSRDFKEKTR